MAASGRRRSKLLQRCGTPRLARMLQRNTYAGGGVTAAGTVAASVGRRPSAARTLRWDENLPRMGFVTTSSFFLGGMVSRIYDSTGWVCCSCGERWQSYCRAEGMLSWSPPQWVRYLLRLSNKLPTLPYVLPSRRIRVLVGTASRGGVPNH